ncbi:unnamed protein product, partial [Ectocarpus fasciculatus]
PPPSPAFVDTSDRPSSKAGSAYSVVSASTAAGRTDATAVTSKKKRSGFGSGPVGIAVATLAWYGLTVVYSVYNTAVLQVFPFPLTVLTAELGAGVLLILPAWTLGIIRTPNLRMSQMPILFYVSLWHSVSNVATGAALQSSSLAMVTAIQALEPLASALVDLFVAGKRSHPVVNAAMIPIIAGVALVSRDASITRAGLFFAVASSVSVGVRDFYSKRASRQREFHKRPLSAANTYAVVTVMSFATVVPYALIVDGPRALRWWATAGGGIEGGARAVASAVREGIGAGDLGGDDDDMATSLAWLALYLGLSGVLLFLHSAAAFKVLEKMGSVTTFSVANSVKRGMVVLFGAVAMGTPVGFVSAFGAAVAVLGTAAYWVARLYFPPRRRVTDVSAEKQD